MSQDKEPERRPAQIIVEAGEILQKLTPSKLATLLFVLDDDIETQVQMADIIGMSSSTITTYLQTLAKFPVPLVQKSSTQYSITNEGKTVISLYDRVISSLGGNLSSVDWGDETEREQLGTLLNPLPNSKSMLPFFVLESMSRQSDLADTQEVRVTDVVSDVEHWEQERGQTATRKQVRWMLNRFEKSGAIKFNSQEDFILEDEAHDLAQLQEELIDLLEDDETDSHSESSEASPSSIQQDAARDTGSTEQSTGINDTEQVGPQPGLQQFSTGGQAAIGDPETVTTLIPTYCLVSANAEFSEETQSQPEPVLPLRPTMSVNELFERASQIRHEHPDSRLELNWVLWSDETPEREEDADIQSWITNK